MLRRVCAWLRELVFFDDGTPRAAALNMALDEALLRWAEQPVLRVYRWQRPAVSFGYFENGRAVRDRHPEREAVRRWTGGGTVLHGQDLTFSLSVPEKAMNGKPGAAETYRRIHHALLEALNEHGIPARMALENGEQKPGGCFENAVPHDVLVHGRKVAGGAQRRTRTGFMHQGSVQGVELPDGFGRILARQLGQWVREEQIDLLSEAEALARGKYETEEWMNRWPRIGSGSEARVD